PEGRVDLACILCCRFLIWTHQTFKSPPRLQTKSFSLNLASRGYLGIKTSYIYIDGKRYFLNQSERK
ncbi:hypothetical protein, partial [Vibrio owensii]|uniref:hypothetical protein n=1 Tax=Vibrio owensii TaxID=696485 RepID=UPI001A7E3537